MAPSRQAIKVETPSALATDLYELTMAAAYFANDMRGEATFELFVRSLPPCRSFLVAAGLAPVLDFLAAARFEDEAIVIKPAYFHQINNYFLPYFSSNISWHTSTHLYMVIHSQYSTFERGDM